MSAQISDEKLDDAVQRAANAMDGKLTISGEELVLAA